LHQPEPEFECQRDIAPGPPTDHVAERGRNQVPGTSFSCRGWRANSAPRVNRLCIGALRATRDPRKA
jgi:hypothetical protein